MNKLSFRSQCSLISNRAVVIVVLFLFGFFSCSRISDDRDFSSAVENNLLSGLPLRFVENIGQTLPEVLYHVEGAGHTVLFESRRVVFNRNGGRKSSYPGEQIILEFPGSNLSAEIHGLRKQSGKTNYYTGSDPSEWYTHISSYGSVIYKGLYPGIDMVCSGDHGTFKNEFHVAEGADPGIIQLSYKGAGKVKLTGNGDLLIRTSDGVLVDAAPVAYQMVDGESKELKISYSVRKGVVGFKLGAYDPGLPLIIDPEFSYVTYYAGNNVTSGTGLAVDRNGYLLFAGHSLATDLPVVNPVQDANAGWEDAFVVKIDTSTGDYVYATYMGGDTSDIVRDFAIDDDGNAYITGSTLSPDFPVSENAYQKIPNGYQEAFLAKLGPDGTVIYSTLLGGADRDYAFGMALNDAQEAYLTGYTASSDFPLNGAFQSTRGGSYDVFISKISAGGDSLLLSTFLGGSEWDGGRSIALDKSENIFITGETESTDYPLINAAQGTLGGLSDAFVTKLSPTGQAIVYSTYLGGAEADLAYDIVIDTSGIAYVCGGSESADFPEMDFSQTKSLKSASEVPETGEDAFITFYDVVGHVIFAAILRSPGFNYYRAMVIMSGGIDPFLLVTGYVPTGVSVMAYAIRDYSEIIEVYEAVPVLELDDETQYYYPKEIYGLAEYGHFVLNMSTTATIPIPGNGTADPSPDNDHHRDNVIVFNSPAQIRVTIATPDSIQYGAHLVAYIKVENISSDVEAKMVKLGVKYDANRTDWLEDEEGCIYLDDRCLLGNIPPGGTMEIIERFKVKHEDDVGGVGTEIRFEAYASGANTNYTTTEKITKTFNLEVHFAVTIFHAVATQKSAQTGMVDLYVNDELIVDDLESGVAQQHDVSIAGIYPKIDITSSTATDNQDPIASYMIDLSGPGNEETISPRDHQIILLEDLDEVIHLYHKRDVQSASSDPSKVDLYVVHGAGKIGSADIRIVDIQNNETILETLFDDLEPDSVTNYISLTPGVVALELSNSDNSLVHEVVNVDLSALAGKATFGIIVPVATTEGVSATLVISEAAAPVGISEKLLSYTDGVAYFNSYPNPFSSAASIVYLLEKPMDLEVSVYNVSGQKIRILHSGFQLEGEHQIHWDGTNESGQQVDPGIYLCLLKTDSGIVTHKLTRVW